MATAKTLKSKDLLFISILWLTAICVVNPIGDFPLIDDWQYAAVINCIYGRDLFVDHDYGTKPHDSGQTLWSQIQQISQHQWAIAITHILAGTPFCLPRGFSFTALRFSTILIGLTGILMFYVLLQELNAARWFSLLSTLCLAFNPIYFQLSNTFMTDVSFTTCCIISAYFINRSILFEHPCDFVGGALFGMLAVLNRQIGLILFVSLALAMLVQKRKMSFIFSMLLIVVMIAILMQIQCLLPINIMHDHLQLTTSDLFKVFIVGIRNSLAGFYTAVLYLGWFLFPVLVAFAFSKRWKSCHRNRFYFFLIVLTIGIFVLDRMMPLRSNCIAPYGLGPIVLTYVYSIDLSNANVLPKWFWFIITIVSLLGGSLLLVYSSCVRSYLFLQNGNTIDHESNRFRAANLFSLTILFCYFVPIIPTLLYDRYLILPMVFMCALIAPLTYGNAYPSQSLIRMPIIISLLLLMIFTVAGTKDFLTWNRTRWIALNELLAQGTSSERVFGGYEFNGWHCYFPCNVSKSKTETAKNQDEYLLAMGAVSGHETIKVYPFNYWLKPNKGQILVLRRLKESPTQP